MIAGERGCYFKIRYKGAWYFGSIDSQPRNVKFVKEVPLRPPRSIRRSTYTAVSRWRWLPATRASKLTCADKRMASMAMHLSAPAARASARTARRWPVGAAGAVRLAGCRHIRSAGHRACSTQPSAAAHTERVAKRLARIGDCAHNNGTASIPDSVVFVCRSLLQERR